MSKNVVIGVAWTYANSDIHLGHVCAYIPGDVLARYHRAKGDNVLMISGTDCHGTPTTERAIRENTTPESIVNRYHEQYVEVFRQLGMSYDEYTLTASPYHHEKVQQMFTKLMENGFLYPKTEDASFCPKCNKFIYDREVEVVCPKCGAVSKGDQCGDCGYVFQAEDLLQGKCRICGSRTQIRKNTNLYLKLSALSQQLEQHFQQCKGNWRKNSVNETEKFLREGLIDRAVTRDLNWGVKVPFEGYDDKRIYVWVDAVWGYVSAVQKYCDEHNLDFRDYWFKGGEHEHKIYMCHGKDNIVFHTIIFPALLMATDQRFLMPDTCVAVEFMNINDEKMSKSKGNAWPMLDMLKVFPADTLRYFCIANGPERKDSNFSFDEFHKLVNSDLVNKFGNFVNRTVNYKGWDNVIPNAQVDEQIKALVAQTFKTAGESIEHTNFRDALSAVLSLVEAGNKYFDEKQPWVLFGTDKPAFDKVVYTCCYIIANLGMLMEPFIPFSAKKIRDAFHQERTVWSPVDIVAGEKIERMPILFERMTDKDVL